MARRVAALVPFYEYDDDAASSAPTTRPPRSPTRRRAGFMRLAALLPRALRRDARALTDEVEDAHLRPAVHRRLPRAVPVQPLRARAPAARRVRRSRRRASRVTDLDGNTLLRPDRLVRRQRVRLRLLQGVHRRAASSACATLGPVLGAYHPVVAYNVARLREISGLDEVSFHMSGTEAVMQAVRLARYHTRRTHLVRFCGAYHGWWGDVQPGVGNPPPARETYTLKDMDEDTLRVLRTRTRHRLRAGQSAAGAASQRQRARATRRWSTAARSAQLRSRGLHRLAAAAARGLHRARHRADLRRGVRRLPAGAAAARRSTSACEADMVTYGKTLGGGLPVGVVCGRKRPDEALPRRPAGRHLLRARHVQLAPLRDGGDARVPAAARDAGDPRRSTATSTRSGTSAPQRLNQRLRDEEPAGAGRQPVDRSGRSATRSRRATTGCCSTTCAPRAWR